MRARAKVIAIGFACLLLVGGALVSQRARRSVRRERSYGRLRAESLIV